MRSPCSLGRDTASCRVALAVVCAWLGGCVAGAPGEASLGEKGARVCEARTETCSGTCTIREGRLFDGDDSVGVPWSDFDGSDPLLLLNPWRFSPARFVPGDLVSVAQRDIHVGAGCQDLRVRSELYAAFVALNEVHIEQGGQPLCIVSGYRSFCTQCDLNRGNGNPGQDVPAHRTQYSVAAAGASEHQTGLAIDIAGCTDGNPISQDFAYTKGYAFLRDHGHEFGFVQSYHAADRAITGYIGEPWHWRYVGSIARQWVNDLVAARGVTGAVHRTQTAHGGYWTLTEKLLECAQAGDCNTDLDLFSSVAGASPSSASSSDCALIFGGTCQSTASSCAGHYQPGFCPGGADNQCCVPDLSEPCVSQEGGQCVHTSQGCPGGSLESGACPNFPASVLCCRPGLTPDALGGDGGVGG